MSFALEELKGVPGDVLSGYAKREEGGKTVYDVTFKEPDIFPLVCSCPIWWVQTTNFDVRIFKFKFAENPETRRTAHEEFDNRLAINAPLLEHALDLRRRITKLLGYRTWADYATEVKMVKTADNVRTVRGSREAFAAWTLLTPGGLPSSLMTYGRSSTQLV